MRQIKKDMENKALEKMKEAIKLGIPKESIKNNSNVHNTIEESIAVKNILSNKSTKNKDDDYIYCLKRIHQYADYITINISSPNTENLRKFHQKENFTHLLKKNR